MASEKTVLYFGIGRTTSSDFLNGFAHERGLAVQKVQTSDEVRALLNRTFPAGVVVEAGEDITELVDLIGTLKGDPFTGIVTNQVQNFDHTGQTSELAAEMKSYAKSLPGSKYVVDRRRQLPTLLTASADQEESLVGTDPPVYASTTN